MKLSKRFGALLLVVCMMLTLIPTAFAASATGAITLTINSPTMSVNGVAKTIDAQGSRAVIYNGNTMLPIAAVIENMGGSAGWNAATRQVTLKYNGQTVVLTLGSKTAMVNGSARTMPVAPYTDNGRTYVWLRTLEYFSGVTVGWRADTRQATVVYPMNASSTPGTSAISLTIKNGADLIFKSMQLAPAGTTNWGANLLSTNLYWNETRVVTASVGQGRYDLRAIDLYGNSFYYYNLDFTGVQSVAVLSLTSGAQYSLTLDGIIATGADSNVSLNIWNKTGSNIISMAYGPANSGVWSSELLSGATINNGTSRMFNLSYSSKSPYYDFRVTYSNGAVQVFPAVNLSSTFGTQIITLNPAGNVTYGNTGAAVSGDTTITFKNSSGVRIDELYMSTSNTSSAWRAADDLLDGTLASGKSDDFKIDLGYSKKWYVRAYDRDGDLYSGSVTFSSTSLKSATLTLDRDGDFSLSRQGSKNDEFAMVLSNTSGRDIYEIYAIDPDDTDDYDVYKDFDSDEYVGSLDDGEYMVLDEGDFEMYGSNDNKISFALFYEDPDDDDDNDDFDIVDVTLSKNFDYHSVVSIYSFSSSSFSIDVNDDDDWDEDDDEILLEIYNKTGRVLEEVQVRDEDSEKNSAFKTLWTADISAKSSDTTIIDAYDAEDCDIRLVFSTGDDIIIEDEDLTSYDYFCQIIAYNDGDYDLDGE